MVSSAMMDCNMSPLRVSGNQMPSQIIFQWVVSVQIAWHTCWLKCLKYVKWYFFICLSAISVSRMEVNWWSVYSSIQWRCESTCPQRTHFAVAARFSGDSAEFLARLRFCPTQSNITSSHLATVQYDLFSSWCTLFAKEKEIVDKS
jgi:hypothetical protein